jgi:hypothetical protein
MSTTGRDWGVTAAQEIDRCLDRFTAARTEDLTQIGVLQQCWHAYQAAAAVVGALVESQLRDGVDLSVIADVLGFAGVADAEQGLAPLRAAADARLHARLPLA